MRPPLLAVVALLAPGAAAAQAIRDDGDIVVLGRALSLPPGTPAYGTVTIDRTRLDANASGRLEDALADVAGFQQFRRSDGRSANPSAQGVTLRALGGNATSRALVLLDGVPIADPFFGSIPFAALSPDRLSAARITRGGGAGAFGGGAVAGTIELVSADRRQLPPLDAGAFYGSDRAEELTASASPTLGTGFATLSARFERGDGFYTTPPDQRVPATARARYRDWSLGLRTVAALDGETELQARGTVFGDDRTLRFAGADSASSGEDASLRVIRRGAWQIDALAYLQARDFANKVISATTYRLTLDQRRTPSIGIGGKIELRPPVGRDHVLRLGSDLRLARGQLYEDAYAASGTVTTRRTAGGAIDTIGLFAEDDWTLGRLVLTGGARLDRWAIRRGFLREQDAAGAATLANAYPDRTGTETNARAGAVWTAGSGVALRAAAYTGFRLPTLNELYRPFVVFPVATLANAALLPERLRGAEIGVDLTPAPGVALGATLFDNRLAGAIGNVTIGANLRERRNLAAIATHGIELTLGARRGALALDASYALGIARVAAPGSDIDGFVPAQSPRHAASATLAWRPRHGPSLSATLRHVGRQYEDDRQTDVLPPATTVDAVAQLPLHGRLTLVARAENVFDVAVVTRNAGGSIDLGTPRRLWLGVRLR